MFMLLTNFALFAFKYTIDPKVIVAIKHLWLGNLTYWKGQESQLL